ncbi:usherin-like isoform X2 [Haemaphysalis longicornis]
MYLQHILGLVILCAGAKAEVLDVTMLSRNFVYGPRSSPKLECYVPPGFSAHFGFSIKEIPFPGVQFRPRQTNGVYVLDVPRNVYPHARTNLYWCDVHGSAISTVTSPAMYYDESDGPTFLPENFTVTTDLDETAILGVQGAPGYNNVHPHVTSWAKLDVAAGTVSHVLEIGNVSTFTIRDAGPGESGVYVASGPRFIAPGKNRAVMKLIVRGCGRDLWGPGCKRSCPHCKNGGQCHDKTGQCICPPGFKGRRCEEACGDDHFGRDCTHRCSNTNPDRSVKSCVDILMCLPDPYGCSCGTGFHGPFCNKSYPIFNNGPSVTNITDQGALVQFRKWSSRRDTGMGTPERYLIQYKEANGLWESRTIGALLAVLEYKAPLLGLHANTAYEVRVLVVDKDGNFREDGAKTTPFRTECGAPTLPPQDVSIDSSSTNEIVVTWKNPAPEHWLCGSVSVVLETNGKSMELTTTPGTNVYRVPVTPYTRMEIQLRLKTPNNKYSKWTAKHIATSAEDAPSVVRNVQVGKAGSRQFLCTWDPPEHANGIIRHYSIVYTPLASRIPSCGQVKQNFTEVIVPAVHTAVNLKALQPYVKYQVSVSAVTIGPGPEYSMTFHTSADVPEGAPADLKLVRTTDTSSSLTWSGVPCEIANGPNLTYYSELESNDEWDQNIRNATTKEVSFTYDNLVPFTRYRAKVFAQNVAGRSPNFSSLTFTTAATDPLPPTLLNTTMKLQDSVSLIWSAPYPPYGLLDHYQLKFFAANRWHNITEHVIAHTVCASKKGLIEQHCYKVNGLEPNEIYYFSLRAKNRGTAYSPSSIELEVKTKEAVPGPPVKLRVVYIGERSVKLLWDSPPRKNGVLLLYKVNWTLTHSFDDLPPEILAVKSDTVNASGTTSFYLRDLYPGSTYTVCVQASTSAGFGDSVCVNFVKKRAVPGPPNNLRSTQEATDSLKIEWDAPTVKNGGLTIYRVNSTLEHTFNDLKPDFWASKSAVVNASEATLFHLRDLPPGSTYHVCVQASTSAGFGKAVCGNFSTKASLPDAPGNFTSEKETTDSLKIHWDAPVEKNGALMTYQVNWTLEHTFDDLPQEMRAMKSTTVNASEATSFQLRDLSPGSTYRVCVRASTSAGFGEAVCGNVFTKTSIPGAPNNLRSTDEAAHSLKIQWDAPTLKNGALTSYWVTSILNHTFNAVQSDVRASKSAALNATEGTSFYLRGLVPGSTYRVCVQASTSAGFGDAACGNFGTKASVPAAPSNLWSEDETTDRLTIHWDAPEEKNGPLEAYRVVSTLVHTFNDLPPEMWSAKTVAVNASGGTSWYLTDLSPGSTYNVCVQASNSAGFGKALCANLSSIVSVPGPPNNLRSTQEATDSLKIEWDAPTVKNGGLTIYRVNSTLEHTFNDLKPDFWASKSAVVNASEATLFHLRDLPPGSTYHVCVQASTSAGFGKAVCGNFSTKASLPDAPGNLTTEKETTDSLKIHWDAPVEKNGALMTYQVNWTLEHTFDDLPQEMRAMKSTTVNASEATSFQLRDLSPGSTYRVCVRASTSAGFGEAVCGNVFTKTSIPGAPNNLRSTDETAHSLKIQWDAPTLKNGALTSYWVNSSIEHTFNAPQPGVRASKSSALNASAGTSFDLRGLVPGSTYRVCVQASTSAGFGDAACDNFGTKASVPAAPRNLWSEEETTDRLTIHWDAPVEKNGPLASYQVVSTLVHTFNDQQPKMWEAKTASVNASEGTSWYLTDLSPGSTYNVCVQAGNSAGFGEAMCANFSSSPTVPGAPVALRLSEETTDSLKIHWDAPMQKNGALTSYQVNATLTHTFNDVKPESWATKSFTLDVPEGTFLYLGDLFPGSTYAVCVQASTSAGFGEALCGNFSTKESAPDAPKNLWSSDETADSVKIHWEAPTQNNGALTGYQVNTTLTQAFNDLRPELWLTKMTILNVSEDPSLYMTDLSPGSTYVACVQASTRAGFGEALCANFSTNVSVPGSPENLWSSERTEVSMKMEWDAPAQKNGVLTSYVVNSTLAQTFNDLPAESWATKSVVLNSSGTTSFRLTELSPGSYYSVCVQASTSAGIGDAVCKNFSTIVSVPDPPKNLHLLEETEYSLKIQWGSPNTKNGALNSYKVNSSLIHTFNDLPVEALSPESVVVNSSETASLFLRNLAPGSTYSVCIQASTNAGFGEAACRNFSTKISVPDSPGNLRSLEKAEDSFKIQWDPPAQKNGALTSYVVNSTLSQTFNDLPADFWSQKSVVLNSTDGTWFYMTELTPGSTYSVCVQASTSAGVGDAVCKNFSTIASVPGPPENLQLLEETEYSLKVQWGSPSKRNGALNSYKVNSTLIHTFNDPPDEALSPQSVLVNSTQTASFYLLDLTPGSTYSVCIQASTNAGFGGAACSNFSTKVSVPDSPGNLRSLEEAEDSLKIQWDPPAQKNGALTSYVVNSTLSQTFNDLPADFWSQKSVVLNSSDRTWFYMTELTPGSTYSVCVQATTSAGVGDAVCENFSTTVSVPGVPERARPLEETEYSLKIEWDSPKQKNGALTGYMVNSTLVHTFNEMRVEALLTKSVVLNAPETASFILPDLSSGSTYLVCIQASTEAGFGEAACNNFSTKVSIPGAPEDVRTSEETESTLKIRWDAPRQRNGVLTSYKVNSSLAHTFNNLEGKPISPSIVTLNASDSNEFYLSHLVPGSAYLFCVQASTQAGFGKPVCKNFSTKASVPGVPENIALLDATEQSLTILWDPPLESNGALTSYQVNLTLSHTFNDMLTTSWLPETVVTEGSETSQFHFKDLTPGTTYQACVQASTSVGFGEAVCDNFSTKASVPEAPANIKLTEHDEHSLKVEWDPPGQRNGALTRYKANSSLAHTFNNVPPDAWSLQSVTLDSFDRPEVYLQDLSPGSAYLVCVQASTTAGFGEAACQNFSTKISVPDSPRNLRSMEQREDSIKIRWDPPHRPNGVVDAYRVNLTLAHTFNDVPAESRRPKSVVLGDSNTSEFFFKDLTPGSTYEVCIEASTSAGFGEAVCKNFSVKTSVPEAPENITLAEQKEHSLKIMWDPPRQKNGALTGYKANISLVRTFNNILPHLWPSKSLVLNAADHPEVCFQNLLPGSTYLVCIEASTNAGFGEDACQNFSTKASTSESPHNFRSTMQTEDSLKIQWDPPHRANGAITGYTVNSCIVDTFNDVPEKSWCPNVVVQNVSATTEVCLQDLVPGSTYRICAQANTIAGFGEAVCDNFTTNTSVPGASEGLWTLEKKEHSLKFMWDPPRQKNGALKSYKINSSLVHTFNDTLLDSWSSTSATLDASVPPIITLSGLFPGSTYLVCVQASTIAGVGKAVCKNFTTKASQPVPQVEPIAKISGHGEVTVVVSPIDYAKGPITGYYVIVGWEACNITEPVKLVNVTTALEMQLGYYVAAYLSPSDLNGSAVEVVVGRGHMIGGFENPPLTGGVAYCFGLLVETNFSGEVLYGYSLTAPLIVNSTGGLPSLPIIIGAFAVFFLIIIAVATLTGCCLRRKFIAAKQSDTSPNQAAEEHGMSFVTTAYKTLSEDASGTLAEPHCGLSSRPDLVKNLHERVTEDKANLGVEDRM